MLHHQKMSPTRVLCADECVLCEGRDLGEGRRSASGSQIFQHVDCGDQTPAASCEAGVFAPLNPLIRSRIPGEHVSGEVSSSYLYLSGGLG